MLWNLDTTHANVDFSVKHMAISTVRGSFDLFSASGETDDATGMPTKLSMEIDAASVNTNNEQRDGHLKSADFFETEKYPKITFVSTKITGTPAELTITGDLTIRGVTKPVVLTGELSSVMKDPWGLQRRSIEVAGKIKRSEFGLTWNQALEMGGVLVSDEVKLTVSAQAVAAAEAEATA
ncbi:MAG TPA: YceI family protein [Gemmatimonadaceae bacterium]|nr:YceI family protein [Gemmatimonadaceae bacterium]HRQ77626.1 YceI family protein [Gemmatimonadaceae bacterium]